MAARTASRTVAMPRRDQSAPAGTEQLHVDLFVARIDDRQISGSFVIGRDVRRREGGQRRQPDGRLARRQRDAARGGDTDPQSGEAARSDGDGDPVDVDEFEPRAGSSRAPTSGIKASAWPRTIGTDSRASTPPCSVSSTAAAQTSSAVSIASTRMIGTV